MSFRTARSRFCPADDCAISLAGMIALQMIENQA
jgi:hypothetical protein